MLDQFDPPHTGGLLKIWQQRLKQVRAEKGFSQEDVARRAGISLSGYRRIEVGKRGNVTLSTLERIAWVLGVKVADLL